MTAASKETLDAMYRHTDAVRELADKDPLSISIDDVKAGREHVRSLCAIDDYEAARSAHGQLVDLVLRAVAKHHHRSADLARVLLERP